MQSGFLERNSPSLFGTKISLGAKQDLLTFIGNSLNLKTKILVTSGNAYSYNLSYEYPWFRAFLNNSDWIRMDGIGVIAAAKFLGYSVSVSSRMTWADFMGDLASFCERSNYSIYFLGAKPNIAQKAASNLRDAFKKLRIVGVHHGYFDKENGNIENDSVIRSINSAKPDILIVGFGMPLQERWLLDNWKYLNAVVTFTGGAVFDYISGSLRRPPMWLTQNSLEWLGRLLIEPRRLWRRYLIGNSKFLWRVFKERMQLFQI